MKTVTVTAIMTLLVAIPFLIWRRRPDPIQVGGRLSEGHREEDLRYDIDDFVT